MKSTGGAEEFQAWLQFFPWKILSSINDEYIFLSMIHLSVCAFGFCCLLWFSEYLKAMEQSVKEI